MKKRLNPIPLISALVICGGIVGYLNFRSAPQTATPEQQQPQTAGDHQLTGPSKTAPTKDELKTGINVGGPDPKKPSLIKPGMTPPNGPPGGMPPGMPPGAMPPGAKFPGPGMASRKPPKPMPNDSSISTQWYTSETNKSN